MSFQQGLSGLNGAQRALDVIGNNVANTSTVGFKQARAQFADVFAATLEGAAGSQVGIGTTVDSVAQQFTQGNITISDNPLDVAINGQGFYRMSRDGAISYTRNGQFGTDKDGFLVNAGNYRLTGYLADATGTILPSLPAEIRIDTSDLVPQATASATVGLNLDSREAVATGAAAWTGAFLASGALPTPDMYNSSTALTAFDTLGNAHVLTLYFVKQAAAGAWDAYSQMDTPSAANPVQLAGASPALAFDTSGQLASAMPLSLSFPVTSGAASPLAFGLDFTGSTQFGTAFGVNRLAQDGYTAGRLAGVTVGADGVVQGRYTNGQARDMAQVVLSDFANPNGLVSLGGNQWAETSESGVPLTGAPGSGSLGVLQSAALEESNVDLTEELVNMITQQRSYQANAQSIRTQDQLMQTLVNLR
ncbi:MAG TPA: flagellar hook protein FlgE [Rhodocyclaceae bacterium]|nr:MAG: flagellar hook protein FlgE [Betaproteobacteria bacterium CG2_30_68_42]PJA56978.1 MAG: flagellar hook protein FlgE [Rhodocyclales bacterium CG_4_9_14_3_um_filter_68_10]HCX32935.1 flagellar hook protein FlgE [Rhodocyclaceae bacterium]